MTTTAFQDREVANKYLDERRGSFPYAADHLEMMLRVVRHFRPNPTRIIDLGCGDGIVARALLSAYPNANAVLVDHSEPMLERAREAMAPFAGRCEIVLGDMLEPLTDYAGSDPADLIVSAYAIHHLPHERKRTLYGEIYDVLTPGGVFVNIEHVASPSRDLEVLWEESFIDFIVAKSGRPYEEVATEFRSRPDHADNILERLETQLEWLRYIGFSEVDCYFKCLELAVFGGVKSKER
jgi:ubiquinone/menaquinone biosynthesis C-methylase UbiE